MIDRLPERLRAKIDQLPGDGCWLWTAADNGHGYGAVWWRNATRRAHVVVYELLVGPVPEGLELDHTCRVKRCVRPDHLESVTHAENMARADQGAPMHQRAKDRCPAGHPYDPALSKPGARRCAPCTRETRRKASARYRERLAS